MNFEKPIPVHRWEICTVENKRQDSDINAEEGKVPIKFQVYCLFRDFLIGGAQYKHLFPLFTHYSLEPCFRSYNIEGCSISYID